MAEPPGAGLVQPVGEARGQGDAVTLHEAAVGPLPDGKPQKRHRPDVMADGLPDPRLQVRLPRSGSVAVEPGIQQPGGQLPALDDGGADMPGGTLRRGGCRRQDDDRRRARRAAGSLPTRWPGLLRSARGCPRVPPGPCRHTSLGPGQRCLFTVRFTPASAAPATATLCPSRSTLRTVAPSRAQACL